MINNVTTRIKRCAVAFLALIALLLSCSCTSIRHSPATYETTNPTGDSFVPSYCNNTHHFDAQASSIIEKNINYIGFALHPVTDLNTNIVFSEFNLSCLGIIDAFFRDGEGNLNTSEGIQFRLAKHCTPSYMRADQLDLQSESDYSPAVLCSLNCLRHRVGNEDTIELFETDYPKATCISTEISESAVSICISDDLSAIDSETESLVTHLVGVLNSNQSSIIGGMKIAVSYVYLRQKSSDEHEYERFVFFSFLRDNGTDILVQWATPYTLIENDEFVQKQKEVRRCFCDFLKELINSYVAEHELLWDFRPVYAEVGHGYGFPRADLTEEELLTLWDFFQRLQLDAAVDDQPQESAYRILFYGPYDTEHRGSEQILQWYISDNNTRSWVRKNAEETHYVRLPNGAADYVRLLCENRRVIARTRTELESAFVAKEQILGHFGIMLS